MAYIGDLLGEDQNTGTSAPAGDMASPAVQALQSGIDRADGVKEAEETERKVVAKLRQEWETAREFDKRMREQFGTDRRYASGKGDKTWASDANLIGSFIDILVSFLYAKNPDVGSRAAAQVGAQPSKDNTLFAETAELVLTRLWKDARLKKAAKKCVRSVLSVGQGWFKAVAFSQTKTDPQVEGQLRDAQDSLAKLQAMEEKLNDPTCTTPEDRDVQIAEIELQIKGIQAKIEKTRRSGLHIDFVRADDMQVSLDVADISDHLEADWNSNDLYIPKMSIRDRFKRLTEEECKKATAYFQRQQQSSASSELDTDKDSDGAYTKAQNGPVMGGSKPVEFARIVEVWDKRDGMVKTFVEGIDKWAVEPYAPPQASNRFYPYFFIALFEVDGERAPQSLAQRLKKLQDEYSAARSGQRLTRERNIPGTIFNSGQISVEDAKKMEGSVHMEYIGIRPTDPNAKLGDIITAKPSANIDARMWDTGAIVNDMERISGVQEALSQGSQTAKTATEAGIQQSGFQSRTGADRDTLEDVFREFAQYTLEVALQEVTQDDAMRIAGPQAFWPYGMDVQDILTLVEVDIDAGSTGKPNLAADRESWAVILPQVQETMMVYRQLQTTDPEMSKCIRNLLRETLRRLDDRMDIDLILPPPPELNPLTGLPLAPGAVPGTPGAPLPGGPATGSVDPSTPMAPAGVTPV